jgi:hypothetical protein
MPGLVPAIHAFSLRGHEDVDAWASPGMTAPDRRLTLDLGKICHSARSGADFVEQLEAILA